MGTTHIVYGDAHAHPMFDNDRADLISKLIQDVSPDVVVNLGDNADMPSLSSYDKGLRHFYNRNYKEDINSSLDFDYRVWDPIRKRKKKLPTRLVLVGNHEQRIEKALDRSPELNGAISLKDLEYERNYDIVVPYSGFGTPGVYSLDGILYAHYVIAGVSGKALASTHQGYQLLQKYHKSVTVGHQHMLSYSIQSIGKDKTINGLCAPCLVDYNVDWAGEIQSLWNRGIIIKHNVEDGVYDLEYVSLDRLRKEYG